MKKIVGQKGIHEGLCGESESVICDACSQLKPCMESMKCTHAGHLAEEMTPKLHQIASPKINKAAIFKEVLNKLSLKVVGSFEN